MDDHPLSKSAQKKKAKQERLQAVKLARRAREREARKEKNRIRAEKRAAGELVDEPVPKKRRKLDFGGTVLVDLSFDDLMHEKEISSLCSQLAYTYSANRNASFPFTLKFTSLNGRTRQRLDSMGDASYTRWQSTSFHPESYLDLSDVDPSKLVYLTADTDDELTELSPEDTYIIGGICDHNRYKNLCLNKAKESGIRTARLPIGTYLAHLPTRKVLTVNQVFEILLKWVETRDWEQALYAVIPKRKFQQGGGSGSAAKGAGADVDAEEQGRDGDEEDSDDADGGREDGDNEEGMVVIDEATLVDEAVQGSGFTPVADPPTKDREVEKEKPQTPAVSCLSPTAPPPPSATSPFISTS